MVTTPVATMLDTTTPEIVPKSVEARIEILAAPPRRRPSAASAMSLKNSPPPRPHEDLPEQHERGDDRYRHVHGKAEHAIGIEPDIGKQTIR